MNTQVTGTENALRALLVFRGLDFPIINTNALMGIYVRLRAKQKANSH